MKPFEWRVALILFGVLFIGVSDTQLIPPLLTLIGPDFGRTPGHAGILVTAYAVAAAGFALFAGPLSDRIGRKKVLMAGLIGFAAASAGTSYAPTFGALLVTRMLTGLAAGALSTCSLSFAADHYAYEQRGKAMGVISMAYFLALVVGVPLAAFAAPQWGWRTVFGGLAVLALVMLAFASSGLPLDVNRRTTAFSLGSWMNHFRRPDRVAAMTAAFLTSGGLAAFMTYFGAWLNATHGLSVQKIGLVFMLAGAAAVGAAPLSGWLADRIGKMPVLVWANILMAGAVLFVTRTPWGIPMLLGLAVLSIAASARQAPLHAVTTEIVGPEIRGEFVAVRNAASQTGIALAASVSAYVFDAWGFAGVGVLAASASLLAPLCMVWIKPR